MSKTSRLRKLAVLRRWATPLVLLGPVVAILVMDVRHRSARLVRFEAEDWQTYGVATVESAVIWGALLTAACRSRHGARGFSAFLFVCMLALVVGGQAYFFQQNGAYLNADLARFATDFTESVINQLRADLANYLSCVLPALTFFWIFLRSARSVVRPTRRRARALGVVAPLLLCAGLFVPTQYQRKQPSTPDVLYLHAIGALIETQLGLTAESQQLRPRARESLPVPKLAAHPARARNVVFVIGESIRKDATCNEFSPNCKRTGATNQLFKDRYPLSQMRALDSSTAISLAVLWSGVGPHESREVLHTWPLVFDYARQAGYHTAYWTSQSMMFGNLRLWLQNLGVESFFTGTDVDPESDIDLGAHEALFTKRALAEVPALREPFFLTIQLSNGHYPYLVDKKGPMPFVPHTTSKAPRDNGAFFNYYQNAIHQQDRHLSALLGHIRGQAYGDRTVIVYTSDHGEAFREHGQMGHTASLYDEEVRVPAWVDAPSGTLSESESSSLAQKRDEFTFHPDLTVTILDLLGVWDDPALDHYKTRILGSSLLRPEKNERALPMTNCADVWSCAFENWGIMRGRMKLEARAWDQTYHCWDVANDPSESVNLGVDACGDLKARADREFGRVPGKKATRTSGK